MTNADLSGRVFGRCFHLRKAVTFGPLLFIARNSFRRCCLGSLQNFLDCDPLDAMQLLSFQCCFPGLFRMSCVHSISSALQLS
jgi:hypothetical protein